MVAGAAFLFGKKLVVSSRWFGKLSTVLFYLAIVSSLAIHFFNIGFQFDIYIYYVALIFTVLSLLMYAREFFLKGYLAKDDLTAEDTTITEKPTKEDKIEAKYNRASNKAKKLEKKKKKLESQLKDAK